MYFPGRGQRLTQYLLQFLTFSQCLPLIRDIGLCRFLQYLLKTLIPEQDRRFSTINGKGTNNRWGNNLHGKSLVTGKLDPSKVEFCIGIVMARMPLLAPEREKGETNIIKEFKKKVDANWRNLYCANPNPIPPLAVLLPPNNENQTAEPMGDTQTY